MIFARRAERKTRRESDWPRQEGKREERKQIARQIVVAVDQLKAVMEQMKLAAVLLNDISDSSRNSAAELMDHSEKTVEYTEKVAKKMRAIEEAAKEIAASSNDIHASSRQFSEQWLHSWNSLETLQKEIRTLRSQHETLLKQMNHLVHHSQRINQIISAIGEISQKTKILSLNANIEAARAGEHGRGFAVVAREIGMLASQTSEAVQQTQDILSLIQREIAATTDIVREETKQIDVEEKEMEAIMAFLHSLQRQLNDMTDLVSSSVQSASGQSDSVKEIAGLLEEIVQLSRENQRFVERVTADMNEQHESVGQILRINEALQKTAEELQQTVGRDWMRETISVDDAVVKNMIQKLSALLQSAPLEQMDEAMHRRVLDRFLSENGEIEAVWSNRLDGTFVYSNPPAGLVNAKVRSWFQEASGGTVYVSDPYVSALTKHLCVTVSAPITDHNGQIVGVIGADLALSK
ncbi:methyl-accepting chemotaxis protein [Geobacillus sp. Y412MC52]|uniref:methyl-accepting chemotaxis protein n=1 Tax=Geobacillus sp. (strain Y412MC52) TaxID=550542 RepID=UPI00018C1DAB|nr:methyl-accepting chemotaxis protein [Geobacillus sp. Y412MC52]ADU94331.1 methyl-accepting chemotaxis sensory transducer with Cache sensor [Geobacillus sp. Y412MC52]